MTHLSKHVSVSLPIAAWMTAFWFSISMNDCSSRACFSSGSASMAATVVAEDTGGGRETFDEAEKEQGMSARRKAALLLVA